jgi:succinate-acetate transporter protein
MSTNPKGRKYPSHWGPVVAMLLIIGGMAFLITGSWMLSDGLNGIVIDHTNPYFHFSETTTAQEITDGIIGLSLGVFCFFVLVMLVFTRRKFLFPA